MRRRRGGLAVFLVAVGLAGTWVTTGRPGRNETVRVEAPSSQPAGGPQVLPTEPPRAGVSSVDDLVRALTDPVTHGRLCEAPALEPTDEQKRAIEQTMSTAPMPPGVPTGAPGDVMDVHHPLVPC